jgi:Tol biopolymer transport system component
MQVASNTRGSRTRRVARFFVRTSRVLALTRGSAAKGLRLVRGCWLGRFRRTGSTFALTVLGAAVVAACGGGEKDADAVSCASPPPAPKAAGSDSGLRGRIVWASDRAGGNLDLFVMAADGAGVRQLTRTPANEALPIWSPDGTEIAFLSFQEELESLDADASPGQIKIMKADGSGVRELTAPEPQTGAVTWSPDGERIAFAAQGNIDVMRTDGTQRRRLEVPGDEDWPSWSPDGDLILVTSSGPGSEQLSTIAADGSSPKELSQKGSEGAWSPDGRSIAFASGRDGDPGARDPVNWNSEIYVTPRDGSHATRITRIPGNDHWPPAWSPDGKHIAFTSDGCKNNWEIFITDTRGSRVLNATHHRARDVFPSWHR